MDKINSQQKGSALIITILFGTVAMSLSLILSTFALNDFRQVSAVDEANTAKYANEAITEMALSEYDLDRDKVFACNIDGTLLENTLIYKKINDDGTATIVNSTGSPVNTCTQTIETDSSSGLKNIQTNIISYFYASKAELEFERNEIKILSIPTNSANLQLKIEKVNEKYINFPDEENIEPSTVTVDFEVTHIKDEISKIEMKNINNLSNPSTQTISIDSTYSQLQIKMFVTSTSSLFTDTTRAKVKISLIPDTQEGRNQFVDSTFTTIEATTEYGSIRKKTITEIDRRSGTIIDQATFVLYGSGGITVQ